MCARKIPLDYRRHLEMQVSDCVVNCIFPSTSTLLNPMRPSSQNLVRKVLLGNNPINLHFRVCFVPNSIKCRTFFAHFVSISVLFVSVIRWHARAFHGRGRTFFRHISRPFIRPFFGANFGVKQTDTLIAPYSKTTFISFCFFRT